MPMAKLHPGARPRFPPQQKKELEAILLGGVRAAGFPIGYGPSRRVAHVIDAHWRVTYHLGHAWYIL